MRPETIAVNRFEADLPRVHPRAKRIDAPPPKSAVGAAAVIRRPVAEASPDARVIVPLNAAAKAQVSAPGLYCFHAIAGTGGRDYLALARHVGEAVRMFGVQAPPARMDEPNFGASVRELAAFYSDEICRLEPPGPLVLAGWSAGAAIALEVAHQLRARGRETALLVAFDGAPEFAAGLRPWDPRYWLSVLANLPAWFFDSLAHDPGFPGKTLSRLAVSWLSAARRLAAGGKSESVPGLESFMRRLDRYPEAQRRFIGRLCEAMMNHRAEAWPGSIAVYEARVRPAFTCPQYMAGWRRVASRLDRTTVDANHFTILREPWVEAVAQDLERRIAAALAEHPAARILPEPR